MLAALCASMLASSRISSKDKTSSPSLLILAGEGISLILQARSAQRYASTSPDEVTAGNRDHENEHVIGNKITVIIINLTSATHYS